jgi:hypothetical protein
MKWISWVVVAISVTDLVDQARRGRVSWWVPAVVIPIGLLLPYVREKYYVPFVKDARARREAFQRAQDQLDVGRQTRQP